MESARAELHPRRGGYIANKEFAMGRDPYMDEAPLDTILGDEAMQAPFYEQLVYKPETE